MFTYDVVYTINCLDYLFRIRWLSYTFIKLTWNNYIIHFNWMIKIDNWEYSYCMEFDSLTHLVWYAHIPILNTKYMRSLRFVKVVNCAAGECVW